MNQRSTRLLFVVAGVLMLGALVHWPLVRSGWFADDYLQREMLEGRYAVARSPLDLYTFVNDRGGELQALMDRGTLPWWSHPTLRLSAVRPLSSALLALGHVFGLSAFAEHVQSLLWWGALVVLFARFSERLLSARVAGVAALIYGLDPAHTMPVGWVANRPALLAAVFGVLALSRHAHWRESGARIQGVLAAVAYGAALASGEYALSVFGYLLAWELCVSDGPSRVRWRALAPSLGLTALYLVLHVALRGGAAASSTYLDPLHAPGAFVHDVLLRLPSLLVNEWLMVPGEITHLVLSYDYLGILFLVPPLGVMALLVRGTIRRAEAATAARLRFLVLGSVLGLLPLVMATPSFRLLVVPCLGSSLVAAAVLVDGWQRLRDRAERWSVGLVTRLMLTLMLAYSHLVSGPTLTALTVRAMAGSQHYVDEYVGLSPLGDPETPRRTWVILNAPEAATLIYVPYVRAERGLPRPARWRALSMTARSERLRRTAIDRFELSVEAGTLLDLGQSTTFRSAHLPLRSFDGVRLAGMAVQVLSSSPFGPTRVAFRFDRSLDDPDLVLLVTGASGLERVKPPPVGGELEVPSFIDALSRAATAK